MKKIRKVVSMLAALAMLSQSAVVVNASEITVAEYKIGQVDVEATPEDWGTNKFGPWSFWAVAEYYDTSAIVEELPTTGLKYINVDDIDLSAENSGYGTKAINPAGDYTYKGFTADNKYGTFDSIAGEGIIVAAKPHYHNNDTDWNADMITYPNSAEGMVRFRAGNRLSSGVAKDKDVAAMFTVPVTGKYHIYLDAVNKGAVSATDGIRYYGNSNFGRISIIPAGESSETAANSTNFAIQAANTPQVVEYDNVCELTAGTRIFVRMHNGTGAIWNDDLFAKLIITKLDANGHAEKIYDLNQAGYTSVDNLRFMTAAKGSTDTSAYLPIYAAPIRFVNPNRTETGYAAHTGIYANAGQQWNNKDYGVYVNGAPNIVWTKATGTFKAKVGSNAVVTAIKNQERDAIVAWTAPEDGTYRLANNIEATASNTADITFTTTKRSKGTNTEAAVSAYTLAAGVVQADAKKVVLSAGDEIFFRVSGASNNSASFTPVLTLVEEITINLSKEATVESDSTEWGTNKLGPWSFWGVKEFYDVTAGVTSLDGQTLSYVNLDDVAEFATADKINAAKDFTANGVTDNVPWGMTPDKYNGAGIIMAANPGYPNADRIYNSDIITYPASADGMVRFRTGNNFSNHKDAAVMFTVPETGRYNVYLDAVNRGMPQADGSRSYGGSNFGRISVIPAGESSETAVNSTDFVIPAANADGIIEYNNTAELTKGTRIFVRLHNGMDMWNDDFFAKLVITRLDASGNVEKVYDLNQASYSTVAGMSFIRAAKGETNVNNYLPMYAAKPENVSNRPEYTGGFVAPADGVVWSGGYTNLTKTPNIGWNTGDEYFTVVTGTEDAIIAWNPDKSGMYPMDISAYTEDGAAATVTISKLKEGSADNSAVLDTINAAEGEITKTVTTALTGNDKLLVRVSAEAEATVKVKIETEGVIEYAYADITEFGAVGDGVTDNTNAISDAIAFAKDMQIPVYVPAGIFVHDDIIALDGCKMFGDGFGLSVLKAKTYQKEAVILSGDGAGLYNLKIIATNGARNNYTSSCVVGVNGATNFEIKNCQLTGGSNSGLLAVAAANGEIVNNIVSDTAADGIFLVKGTNNVTVEGNLVYNTRDDSIAFTTFVEMAKQDDGLVTESDYTRDIVCKNNTVISTVSNRGITVNGAQNVQILNNYVDGTSANICIGADASWNSIQNYNIFVGYNTLKNTALVAAENHGGAITLRNDNNVTEGTSEEIYIYGNDIYNPAQCAVLVYGDYPIKAEVYENNFYLGSGADVAEYVNSNNSANASVNISGNYNHNLNDYAQDANKPGNGNEYASRYSMPETGGNLVKGAEIVTEESVSGELIADGIAGEALKLAGETGEIEFELAACEKANTVVIYDSLETIDSYDVYVMLNGSYQKAATCTAAGKIKAVYFDTVETDAIKLVISGNNVTADEIIITNAEVDVTESGLESLYTPWSFVFGPTFYTGNGDSFSYQDMKDFDMAYDFSSASTVSDSTFITARPYSGTDRLYTAYVKMQDNQESDLTYYGTSGSKTIDMGVATCFSVPADGCYKLNWSLINKGTGNGNFARVTVLRGDETLENTDNTDDFEVTSEWTAYESEVLNLNKGDKLYTRVYSGTSIKGDDIYGSLKISETTVNGTPIKVYDLNRLAGENVYDVKGAIVGETIGENGFVDAVTENDVYSYEVSEEGFYRVILSGMAKENESVISVSAGEEAFSLTAGAKMAHSSKLFKLEAGDTVAVTVSADARARVQVSKVTADILTEYVAAGEKTNEISDDFTAVKYIVNTTETEKTVKVVGAIYDGSELKNIVVYDDVTIGAGAEVYETYEITVDTDALTTPVFKMFVWDSAEGMVPHNIPTQLN